MRHAVLATLLALCLSCEIRAGHRGRGRPDDLPDGAALRRGTNSGMTNGRHARSRSEAATSDTATDGDLAAGCRGRHSEAEKPARPGNGR